MGTRAWRMSAVLAGLTSPEDRAWVIRGVTVRASAMQGCRRGAECATPSGRRPDTVGCLTRTGRQAGVLYLYYYIFCTAAFRHGLDTLSVVAPPFFFFLSCIKQKHSKPNCIPNTAYCEQADWI